MRFLFATNHSYMPQRAGGSESSTHELCSMLSERGDQVAVLAALSARGWTHLANRIARILRPACQFPADRRMGYPVFRGEQPEEGVGEVVDRFRPSVAIVQSGAPMSMASRLVTAGLPTLIYLRDVLFHKLGAAVLPADCAAYVASSEFIAQRFADEFGIRPTVIPPLVRPERYRTESSRRVVTFICPVRRKGLETALALAETRPDVPFVFAESWPLDAKRWSLLEARVRDLENVTLHRRQSDMRKIYGDTKLLLVPSLCEEGWGRVVTEAQVNGIPALAARTGGLAEAVGPGGILVERAADLCDWQRALARIWDDKVFYAELSDAALSHAQRPEIQPCALLYQLTRIIEQIVEPIDSDLCNQI